MIGQLLSQTVILERRPDSTLQDPPAETVELRGYLEPAQGSEELEQQETYVTIWKLFLPAGAPVAATDTVRIDDRLLEVVSVLPFYNPRTRREHHVECRCREVDG